MTDRLAVFDLDGTLVDTAPDLAETTNAVLAAHGLPTVPTHALQRFIGLGARAMIAAALTARGIDPASVDMEAIHADYIARYSQRIARLSRPFPEIEAALAKLAEAGVAMAVCTNKREDLARLLLGELGLAAHFVALAGGDTFAVSKPHPDHLLGTIARAGARPGRSVFVGDSRIDFETARAAGVPFVGLTYGYSDVPVRDLGPDRLCEPGEDIADAVLSLLGEPALPR